MAHWRDLDEGNRTPSLVHKLHLPPGARGLEIVILSHALIFSRPAGTGKRSNPEMLKRAARLANGGLLGLWRELVAETGAKADDSSPRAVSRPPNTPE